MTIKSTPYPNNELNSIDKIKVEIAEKYDVHKNHLKIYFF